MLRKYGDIKFAAKSLATIKQANAIIDEYIPQGLVLTLRQLYYQFVGRNLMENTQANYDRLGKLISDARIAGLVSWEAIEDRTRQLLGHQTQAGVKTAMTSLADTYKLDLWEDQEWRPEVWIEKQALIGVIEQICSKLRVDYFACRGYSSQSEQWRAGRRFARYIQKGQRPIVFHLGDHDPSGVDMTRDNRDRLSLFAGVQVTVHRLALNWEQIEALKPPENPAKIKDSRIETYKTLYGRGEDHPDGPLMDSWELDALDPVFLQKLVEDAIRPVRDQTKFDLALERETTDRRVIADLARDLER